MIRPKIMKRASGEFEIQPKEKEGGDT